jgi:hypothetical protein
MNAITDGRTALVRTGTGPLTCVRIRFEWHSIAHGSTASHGTV